MKIYGEGLIILAAAHYVLAHTGQVGTILFCMWTALHAVWVLSAARFAITNERKKKSEE